MCRSVGSDAFVEGSFSPNQKQSHLQKEYQRVQISTRNNYYKDKWRGSGKRMSQALGTQVAYLPNNSKSLPTPNPISRPISSSSLIFVFCSLLSSGSFFSVPCCCSQLCLSSMEAKLLGAYSPAIRSHLASDLRPNSLYALKTKQTFNFVIFKSSFSKKGIQSVRALAVPNGYRLFL